MGTVDVCIVSSCIMFANSICLSLNLYWFVVVPLAISISILFIPSLSGEHLFRTGNVYKADCFVQMIDFQNMQ